MVSQLEKQILNLENEYRRIDAPDILFVLYDFPKWHQIREISGYGNCFSDNLSFILDYLKNGIKDKVWLDKDSEM